MCDRLLFVVVGVVSVLFRVCVVYFCFAYLRVGVGDVFVWLLVYVLRCVMCVLCVGCVSLLLV